MKTALLPLVTLASLLTLSTSWALAQDKPGEAPFAYAAPAFIKELDTRFPAQPPVPPSPRATAACSTSPPWCAPSIPPRATVRSWPWCGTP